MKNIYTYISFNSKKVKLTSTLILIFIKIYLYKEPIYAETQITPEMYYIETEPEESTSKKLIIGRIIVISIIIIMVIVHLNSFPPPPPPPPTHLSPNDWLLIGTEHDV